MEVAVAVAVAAGVRWRGAGGVGVSWTTGSLLASASVAVPSTSSTAPHTLLQASPLPPRCQQLSSASAPSQDRIHSLALCRLLARRRRAKRNPTFWVGGSAGLLTKKEKRTD